MTVSVLTEVREGRAILEDNSLRAVPKATRRLLRETQIHNLSVTQAIRCSNIKNASSPERPALSCVTNVVALQLPQKPMG